MCRPSAPARISSGEALLTLTTKWKGCMATLPAPPPPPAAWVPVWFSPQDHDSTSMAPLGLHLGVLSLALDAVEDQEKVSRCHGRKLPRKVRPAVLLRSGRSRGPA